MISKKMITWINIILLFCGLAISANSSAVEKVTYLHTDALGSPIAASDAAGKLLWKEDYHPFGEPIRWETNDQRQLYTAQPYDDDLKLSYYGARWYDPAIGRFMGVDPAPVNPENIYSFNRYAYANNNPYQFVDPDGNEPVYFNKVIGGNIYHLVAQPLIDIAPTATMQGDIKGNPTGHDLTQIKHGGEILYMSPTMGGDNQAYSDKVKENAFSDAGDLATASTVACPACAPVTAPIAGLADAGELFYSNNKVKTIAKIGIGKLTAGAGKFIGKDLGAVSEKAMTRFNSASSLAGEKWFGAMLPSPESAGP